MAGSYTGRQDNVPTSRSLIAKSLLSCEVLGIRTWASLGVTALPSFLHTYREYIENMEGRVYIINGGESLNLLRSSLATLQRCLFLRENSTNPSNSWGKRGGPVPVQPRAGVLIKQSSLALRRMGKATSAGIRFLCVMWSSVPAWAVPIRVPPWCDPLKTGVFRRSKQSTLIFNQ